MEKSGVLVSLSTGLLAGIATADILAGFVVIVICALLSALVKFNNARGNSKIRFDILDFFTAMLASVVAGILAMIIIPVWIDDPRVALVSVGIASIAGFQGLTAVKDFVLDSIRQRLNATAKTPDSNHTPPDDWNK